MPDQPSTPARPPEDEPSEDAERPPAAAPQDEAVTAESAAARAPEPPRAEHVPTPPSDRSARLRAKAPLAAAAAALVLISGLGGFAIGHAADDDGRRGFRPANFSGQPGLRDGEQRPPQFRDGDRGHGPQEDSGDQS